MRCHTVVLHTHYGTVGQVVKTVRCYRPFLGIIYQESTAIVKQKLVRVELNYHPIILGATLVRVAADTAGVAHCSSISTISPVSVSSVAAANLMRLGNKSLHSGFGLLHETVLTHWIDSP